ncbi:CRISPR/Cas system CSM-associated protein Csm3 (group 7 of RAMP superfamily) [Paenibacillus sp. RC254]|uniref:RAMP superfamily CRISPR-associated protein n=1 Tax=unclassified Paenibacillus TaxID=185978 RepID=UPI0024BAAAA2|nr:MULTISPECIES: RAMP superfamily CRISPR-associated protein [unclassified Paenibacillus]
MNKQSKPTEHLKLTGKITERYCIQLTGRLGSPLLAGSGDDRNTDSDVIVDYTGRPFVPGSALAGAFRHFLQENVQGADNKSVVQQVLHFLFGGSSAISTPTGLTDAGQQSRLIIYDMSLEDESAVIGIRDGVKLDSYKSAEDEGKYEVQMVEAGAGFILRLEWLRRDTDSLHLGQQSGHVDIAVSVANLLMKLIDGLVSGDLTIGAKGRRGFGKLQINQVHMRRFDYTDRSQATKWLVWNWRHKDAFDKQTEIKQWQAGSSKLPGFVRVGDHDISRYCKLVVPLRIRHTLMIRSYLTKGFQENGVPVFEQLRKSSQAGNGQENPAVIPGTSWMGAIRERLNVLLEEVGVTDGQMRRGKLEKLFGTRIGAERNDNGRTHSNSLIASLIRVEESVVAGGHPLTMTRNKIDRFTGGTVEGALFTSIPWVGGATELVLRWERASYLISDAAICGLLLWIVRDLEEGLLAVGGETAIGRGLFSKDSTKPITLDGQPLLESAYSPYYLAALKWCQAEHIEQGANT